MDIASLVLGIVSICLLFVPCIGWFALVPAIVGLVLGIIGRVNEKKANQPTGKATAGIVLCIIACICIVIWAIQVANSVSELGKAIDGLKDL